jgi:hypothetical protein
VINCGSQIHPPTTFDFSFRNVWHAPPLMALRRVSGRGGRPERSSRIGFESLSAASSKLST